MNMCSGPDALKGVGEKTKKIFERAGIFQLGDLLHYYPRAYDIYENMKSISEIREGETAAVCASLSCEITVRYVKRLNLSTVILRDSTGCLQAFWYNMPYLKNTLKPGKRYVFRGKAVRKGRQTALEQPAIFDIDAYVNIQGQMQPLYPLVDGLTNKMVKKAVRQVLDELEISEDMLPDSIREKWKLDDYQHALSQIHFPDNETNMRQARQRLVFDEFFLFILALRSLRNDRIVVRPSFFLEEKPVTAQVIQNLPFSLTAAQQKVWRELEQDLTGNQVMARLIQGDVGSGKTILAVLALILTAANGLQGALMVPTEVLARQHYESITELIQKQALDFKAVLLTGSMTAKEKREAYQKISSGFADIIIGTHALIQEKADYQNLALVITDEQHRFGVNQRANLAMKGNEVHTLVMSATPIPRTLALMIYGDLDLSILNELPKGRQQIRTDVVDSRYHSRIYEFIKRAIARGEQAYIVCPLVEEGESDLKPATQYAENLSETAFKGYNIGLLHGKMKPKNKENVMTAFSNGDVKILVSTTVIEVGVDVPNATVMVIENAERFGLSQLHQLRGRVGRGSAQSYCILVSDSKSETAQNRLAIMKNNSDGFKIADEDLKQRGPGDFFGNRQHGLPDLKIADMLSDTEMLNLCRQAADEILAKDYNLDLPENKALADAISDMFRNSAAN